MHKLMLDINKNTYKSQILSISLYIHLIARLPPNLRIEFIENVHKLKYQ